MNTTSRYYPSQPALADLGRVPGVVKSVFEYLKSLPRKFSEWWKSAATIAAELGYSKRAVQEAIKALIELGYVAYRTDYGLKTRRAIVMLWRVEAQPSESVSQPSESQAKSSESAHVAAVAEPDVDAVSQVSPRAEAPREPEATKAVAATLEAVEVTKTGRKATAEEVAKLIEDARRLHGGDPELVKELARAHGLGTVQAAVKHALSKGVKSIGWVCKALPNWSRNGIPEYAQIKTPKYTDEEAKEIMHRKAEEILAKLPKLTDAEIDAHWDWVLKENAWYLDKVAGHITELEKDVVV